MSLHERRRVKGLTLHQLADLSGVNYMKIHYIEHGKIKPENIALKTAIKLARALDCEPENLLEEAEKNV